MPLESRRAIPRDSEEPDIAHIRQSIRLKHRANLGEEAMAHTFEAGDSVEILKEWQHHYLCKDSAGRLFNIPKDHVQPD